MSLPLDQTGVGAAPQRSQRPDRPDVFVSYAREDQAFVWDRLVSALKARGKTVWIDRADIPLAADWRERIQNGIDAARACLFVLSPDSVVSEECAKELRLAANANKRLIPVVYRDVAPKAVPEELNRPNWIPLHDNENFDVDLEQLIGALDTDLDWVDRHARLAVRAREWERGGRDRSLLLRGSDLRVAERWLADEESHRERATADQREYILAGRQAATRRRLLTLAAAATALIVSIALGALAIVRAQQRQTALHERQLADSRQVAAEGTSLLASRPDLSMLLGVEAYRIAPTADARAALLSQQSTTYAGSLPPAPQGVHGLAFSPDGSTLATLTQTGISLWDAATHTLKASIAEPPADLSSILPFAAAFSPNGKYLAVAGSGRVVMFDAHHPHVRVGGLATHSALEESVSFSPDGRMLASTYGRDGVILAVATGRVVRSFRGFPDVSRVGFSPVDPNLLAVLFGHQTLALIDPRSGARIASFPGDTNSVYGSAFAFSADGRSLAIGGPNHTITVWSVRTRRLRMTLTGAPNSASGIAFSPDGHLIASVCGSAAILWDARTGGAIGELPQLSRSFDAVAFTADGRLLATSSDSDGGVSLWRPLEHYRESVGLLKVAFGARGALLAVADQNNTVTVLNARTHVPGLTLTTADNPQASIGSGTRDVAFSRTGRILVTIGRDRLWAWSMVTGASLGTLTFRHFDFLDAVAVSPDGRTLAVAGTPGPIALIDLRKGRQEGAIGNPSNLATFSELTYTSDGRYLIADGGTITVWDNRAGRQAASISASGSVGDAVSDAVSPDNRTLAAGYPNGTIVLSDLRTGRKLPRQLGLFGAHLGPVTSLAFSPDGRLLASGGQDATIKLWDLRARKLLETLTGHDGTINSLAFAPDGTLVSAGNDGKAIFWQLDPRAVAGSVCATLHANLSREDWARYIPDLSYRRVC